MARVQVSSPYIWQAQDFTRTRAIRLTVTFDNSTRALQGATVARDAGCLYSKVYVGLGGSGRPDDTSMVFPVPAGTVSFTAQQMALIGLHTIEDVLAFQLTAGP